MPQTLRAAIHEHHITPAKTLVAVFAGLIFLTVLTVVTAAQDLGAWNIPVALTIAVGKALLVILFFMALKYDNQVNTLVLSIGIIMVVVFISFTLLDTAFRGDADNMQPETVSEIERRDAALEARDPGVPAPASAGEASGAEQ
jgi:cytochrome c oxidase subunit 4